MEEIVTPYILTGATAENCELEPANKVLKSLNQKSTTVKIKIKP